MRARASVTAVLLVGLLGGRLLGQVGLDLDGGGGAVAEDLRRWRRTRRRSSTAFWTSLTVAPWAGTSHEVPPLKSMPQLKPLTPNETRPAR